MLVHPAEESFVFVLLFVVDLQIPDEWLDVARDPLVFHRDLREEGELALGHVESGIGAKQVVEGGEFCVFHRQVEIEVGALMVRSEATVHTGLPAAHEGALRLEFRHAFEPVA